MNKMKIYPFKLTEEQESLIKKHSSIITTVEGEKYYNLPYWFKQVGEPDERLYQMFFTHQLPDDVKIDADEICAYFSNPPQDGED